MSKVLRIIDGEAAWFDKSELTYAAKPPKPVVSDGLGVIPQQVHEMQVDAKLHGFTGIEFKPDPTCPQDFMQCHCTGGESERQRYITHRGMRDHCSRNGSGAMLSEEMLRQAEALARRAGPATRTVR